MSKTPQTLPTAKHQQNPPPHNKKRLDNEKENNALNTICSLGFSLPTGSSKTRRATRMSKDTEQALWEKLRRLFKWQDKYLEVHDMQWGGQCRKDKIFLIEKLGKTCGQQAWREKSQQTKQKPPNQFNQSSGTSSYNTYLNCRTHCHNWKLTQVGGQKKKIPGRKSYQNY